QNKGGKDKDPAGQGAAGQDQQAGQGAAGQDQAGKDQQAGQNQAGQGAGQVQTCAATFVAGGGTTASGEQSDPNSLTAGSSVFPIGTLVKVTNPDTKKSVTVRINDKNSFCVAMQQAAFDQIRTPGKNLIRNAQVQAVGNCGQGKGQGQAGKDKGKAKDPCDNAAGQNKGGKDKDPAGQGAAGQDQQAGQGAAGQDQAGKDQQAGQNQAGQGAGQVQTCAATFVAGGGTTASGEQSDPNSLTAGSSVFPIGTLVKVTNPDTKKSVTVRIND